MPPIYPDKDASIEETGLSSRLSKILREKYGDLAAMIHEMKKIAIHIDTEKHLISRINKRNLKRYINHTTNNPRDDMRLLLNKIINIMEGKQHLELVNPINRNIDESIDPISDNDRLSISYPSHSLDNIFSLKETNYSCFYKSFERNSESPYIERVKYIFENINLDRYPFLFGHYITQKSSELGSDYHGTFQMSETAPGSTTFYVTHFQKRNEKPHIYSIISRLTTDYKNDLFYGITVRTHRSDDHRRFVSYKILWIPEELDNCGNKYVMYKADLAEDGWNFLNAYFDSTPHEPMASYIEADRTIIDAAGRTAKGGVLRDHIERRLKEYNGTSLVGLTDNKKAFFKK